MKVNIKGVIHDSEKEPIHLILDADSKENIKGMGKEISNIIEYPANMDYNTVRSVLGLDEKGNFKQYDKPQLLSKRVTISITAFDSNNERIELSTEINPVIVSDTPHELLGTLLVDTINSLVDRMVNHLQP